MKFRHISVVTALALGAHAMHAQTKAANDALSGIWSGYIGRSAANNLSSAKVELKVEPDGAVSGSISGAQITPGEIKAGTYDRSTGALKFTVVISGTNGNSAGGSVGFDGRIANDPDANNALTAAGTLTLGGEKGVFKFVKEGASVAGASGAAKSSTADSGVPEVRRGFAQVSDWVTRAADLVPADKYSYRPVATVRTYGQLVAHVVDGLNYYCGRGAGKDVQWTDAAEKGTTTKPALVAALKQAMSACTTVYNSATQLGPLMENVAHANLHYGNMVTYIRMLGLVPPSS